MRSAWPPARSARTRLVLANRTSAPARMARWPRAWATWVLPTPTGPVEDDRLAGVEPAQRGEVADLRGGQFRVGGEVEPFQGEGLLEPGAADAAGDGGGLPAGDLVVAEDLQELQVAEFPGAGLGQAGVEGLQHPAELQRAQRRGQRVVVDDRRAHGVRPSGVVGVVGAAVDGGSVTARACWSAIRANSSALRASRAAAWSAGSPPTAGERNRARWRRNSAISPAVTWPAAGWSAGWVAPVAVGRSAAASPGDRSAAVGPLGWVLTRGPRCWSARWQCPVPGSWWSGPWGRRRARWAGG